MKQEISDWDGKSADHITLIYNLYKNEPAFTANLVQLIQQVPLQKGATWLLKHHLENHHKITAEEVLKVYDQLPRLEHWETKLHILQCMDFMPVAVENKQTVESFLRDGLANKNKFVRAWSYNGLYLLAMQYPEYQKEVRPLLEQALVEEAASVKARIRKLLKKGFE